MNMASNGYGQESRNGRNGHHCSETSPNPFIYRVSLTRRERFAVLLMAFTLAPIKVVLTVSFLALAWIPASLSVIGLPLQPDKPFTWWRRQLVAAAAFLASLAAATAGILSRTIKGKRATSEEASLLVLAPHASFMDPVVGVICGLPGAVSVIENVYLPVVGVLFRANQSIFLDKKDPDSRTKAAEAIRQRAAAKGAWPQLLVYPEGMIGNQSCLLPFKLGAFQPGVPVQPVTVKYPNRIDCTTWLDSGPSLFTMATFIACIPLVRMEVEFHPVYHPSEQEKTNPQLYASNVRNLMSQYLDIPTTELGYKDMVQLIKQTRPNRGPLYFWWTLLTQGSIEMPTKEHFS